MSLIYEAICLLFGVVLCFDYITGAEAYKSNSVQEMHEARSSTASTLKHPKRLTLRQLLKPHIFSLSIGFLAVVGEAIANLLQPWPLKIVLDEVFRANAGKTGIPHFV